jgi:hypothetical protein
MSLNPGLFTIQEHVIITIMASVGSAAADAVGTEFGNISQCYLPCFLHHLQTEIVTVQSSDNPPCPRPGFNIT